ncbi:thiol reductant ABC exporter subunit CydC [Pelagibaculum spongiae]|uniref:Thiol reductant ABC exporter subunit CydC n=1 Tax=Pelagibaculum spongiae TaxID=2080658 RepID=A0A2V1GXL3_9GAMM|nr:thiol reductant ABC exporter subunit CydC [Pelagibaculum spongiae]PVZ70383.1 thiol reductant ABC exporter subunit CydC [Pelagibaculum spongiae]
MKSSPLGFFIGFFVKQRPWWLLAGVLTLLFSWLSSLMLLGVSGWFISAAGIAGAAVVVGSAITFNFFYPAGTVRFAAMARTATRYLDRLVSHEATFRLLADLRVWLFKRMLFQPLQHLGKLRQGDLLNRLTSDIDALDNLYLRVIAPLIAAALLAAILVVVSQWLMPPLLWPGLGLMLAAGILLPLWTQKKAQGDANKLPEFTSQIRINVLDGVQGLAELKSFNRLDDQLKKIQTSDQQRNRLVLKQVKLEGFAAFIASGLTGIALCSLLWFGVDYLADLSKISAEIATSSFDGPKLVAAVFILMGLSEAILPLAPAFRQLVETTQSAKRLLQIKTDTQQSSKNTLDINLDRPPLIALENIQLSLQETQVLSDFNGEIQPGEKVLLSGASGCGKSSLAKLLVSELDADSGNILLNHRSLNDYSEQSRNQLMGYLPQQTQLLSDTVANNLRLAAHGKTITDDQLWNALQLVGLKETILNMPEKLDSWLGESGVNLSGGQARRLALAVLLVADFQVLLLDEPFEGLDDQIAQQISEHLMAMNKTIILISHRQVDRDLPATIWGF